jgi:hypothetical protein
VLMLGAGLRVGGNAPLWGIRTRWERGIDIVGEESKVGA